MDKTWVMTADAARARIFAAESPRRTLREITSLLHTQSREHQRDLEQDKPGRSYDSFGEGRHAMGSDDSTRDNEAVVFAREVSQHLSKALAQGDYKRLVICAAPRFLGLLRQVLPKNVRAHVVLEIDKDLAHIQTTKALRKHLPERF